MTRPLLFPFIVVVSLGLALTGCSAAPIPGSPSLPGGTSSDDPPSGSSSKAPASAPGALPAHCPTAAQVGSALGTTVPDPDENSSDNLLSCTYADSSDIALVVLYEPVPAGTSIDQIKADVQSKTGGSLGTLSGIRDGGFTLADSDSNFVYVISGGIQFAIGGTQPLGTLERAASRLLAG